MTRECEVSTSMAPRDGEDTRLEQSARWRAGSTTGRLWSRRSHRSLRRPVTGDSYRFFGS